MVIIYPFFFKKWHRFPPEEHAAPDVLRACRVNYKSMTEKCQNRRIQAMDKDVCDFLSRDEVRLRR